MNAVVSSFLSSNVDDNDNGSIDSILNDESVVFCRGRRESDTVAVTSVVAATTRVTGVASRGRVSSSSYNVYVYTCVKR